MRYTLIFTLLTSATAYDCSRYVSVYDLQDYMEENANQDAADNVDSGSLNEVTMNDNEDAFDRYIIRPRVMQDVSNHTMTTNILGVPMSFPVGVAPLSVLELIHKDADKGIAAGAAQSGVLSILSTFSSDSIEDVAASTPNGNMWFQLYFQKNRNVTASLVKRAEKAKYKGLVLTVTHFGIDWKNVENGFGLPDNMTLGNFNLTPPYGTDMLGYARSLVDKSVTWKEISWLKNLTNMNVIIKGIMTPEDAKLAVENGADAIIVSNDGGRSLDGTAATIDALEDVVKAVGPDYPVFMDGGIRTGTDVFKALALGAKAVFIGRPAAWGLSTGGAKGVTRALDILKREFDAVMEEAGVTDVAHVNSDMVVRQSYYMRYVPKKGEP